MNSTPPGVSRPNYRAVAKAAEVSVSTISRYFNGQLRVRPETEQRIHDAVAALGYPQVSPRPTRQPTDRHAIGLLLPHLGNSYFSALADFAARAADAQGYSAVIVPTLENLRSQQDTVDMVIDFGVDGLIYLGGSRINPALVTAQRNRVPVVVVDEDIAGIAPADKVLVDDYAGAYQATAHLCTQGHTEIALLTGPTTLKSSQERHRGFADAMTGAGLDPDAQFILHGTFDEDFGSAALSRLVAAPRRPTAVFAASDVIALGILGAAGNLGVSIPQDLSVVGFDDIPEARLVTPRLTTVRTPLAQMARTAVSLLIDRIGGSTVQTATTLVPVRLEVRESTRAPA